MPNVNTLIQLVVIYYNRWRKYRLKKKKIILYIKVSKRHWVRLIFERIVAKLLDQLKSLCDDTKASLV